MKKIILRISLAGALLLAWWASEQLVNFLEKQSSRVKLTFTLPIPQASEDKFGFSPKPEDISRVYVTGFFSGWSPTPKDFLMTLESPGVWTKEVDLDPGSNQYKFVFFTQEGEGPFWTFMNNSDGLTPDFFGSFNNVHIIPEWEAIRIGVGSVFIAALFSLILFLVFDSVIRRLMNFRVAFRWKILWVLGPVLVLMGIFITAIQLPKMQALVFQSFTQEANWLHGILTRQGVDFTKLSDPKNQALMDQAMTTFFGPLPTRVESSKPVNTSVGLDQLSVFDPQGNLLSMHFRQESRVFYEQLVLRMGYPNLRSYGEGFQGRLLKKMLQGVSGNLKTPRYLDDPMLLETWFEKILIGLQGGDIMAVPLWDQGQVQGYFVYNTQYHLFGTMVLNSLIMNLLILGPILLVVCFLLFRTGRIITGSLETLTSWTQRLIQGDFSAPGALKTGDELETLSKNFDLMRQSLEKHQRHLEQLVEERTAELQAERLKSENLLLNILPPEIARRLKESPEVIADGYESVSVLFADIVNFSQLASRTGAPALVQFLNRVFSLFDEIMDEFQLEKIKTIGDAYMAAGGLRNPDPQHCLKTLQAAQAMIHRIQGILTPLGEAFQIRVGLHVGPVVAGVIGTRKFIYDLWGETVNLASRMESHGAPGRIHVTDAFFQALGGQGSGTPNPPQEIKGHGIMKTWFVD